MSKKSLSLKSIQSIDKSSMLDLLLDFSLQCQAAVDIAENCNIPINGKKINKILFAGLGGSAIGADLIRSYLYSESKLPIIVFREYELPAILDRETLVFILSYSGNTEETLSAYNQAKRSQAMIIAISSDGQLKESCLNDNTTFVEIPSGLPPRCALGYLSIIPLKILERLGLASPQEAQINETITVLKELRDRNLNPRIAVKENISKYIANKLFNKFCVVYSASVNFDVVLTRFRAQLNENSKTLASSHQLPEMNHNEIVGWQNPKRLFKNFVVLFFRDKGIHPRVQKRIDISREILRKENISILEISSRGESLLSRIFSLIYIGDFISFYLAILYGIDPTPVERIAYLKKQLTL